MGVIRLFYLHVQRAPTSKKLLNVVERLYLVSNQDALITSWQEATFLV